MTQEDHDRARRQESKDSLQGSILALLVSLVFALLPCFLIPISDDFMGAIFALAIGFLALIPGHFAKQYFMKWRKK